MASLAVTFGSVGDIVVVVQLVTQLYNTLNGVAGVPTVIQLLARRLRLYKDILADVEEVLCRPESSLKPRTRAGIEDQLKGCHDTLLALTQDVTAFTDQLHRARTRGPRRPILLFMLGVHWQYVYRPKVAALRVQLDEYFSVLDRYLTISQCNNQDALLAAAKDNRVSTTKILSIIDSGPQNDVVGDSVMQLYDWESNTYYGAFAVVPVRMLAAYLQPMISLLDTVTSLTIRFYAFRGAGVSGKSFAKTLALKLKPPFPPDTRIKMRLKNDWHMVPGRTTIFQCIFFSPASGEPHALLGVPPSDQQDLLTRILSDMLRGELHGHLDAGLYKEESREALYLCYALNTYNRLIDSAVTAAIFLGDKVDILLMVESLSEVLQRFPDPDFVNRSTEINYVETARRRGYLRPEDLWKFVEVLRSAPKVPGMPEATRSAGSRFRSARPHLGPYRIADPITAILAQMGLSPTAGERILSPPAYEEVYGFPADVMPETPIRDDDEPRVVLH